MWTHFTHFPVPCRVARNQKRSTSNGNKKTKVRTEKKATKKNDESRGTKMAMKEKTDEEAATTIANERRNIVASTVGRKVRKVYKKT